MLTAVHPPLSRRRLLLCLAIPPGLGAVGLLSSCTDEAPEPPPDPERLQVEAALDVEQALLETVVRWDDGDRQALDVVAVVTAHVTALESTLGVATSPSPNTTSPSPSVSGEPTSPLATIEVLTAVDEAVDAHTRALRTASAAISPLLASVAASDAALAATLRRGAP